MVGSVVQKVTTVTCENDASGCRGPVALQQYDPVGAQSVLSSHATLPALQLAAVAQRGPPWS